MDDSLSIISSAVSYFHTSRLLSNLLMVWGKIMLKFWKSNSYIGIKYFLHIFKSKATKEGQSDVRLLKKNLIFI